MDGTNQLTETQILRAVESAVRRIMPSPWTASLAIRTDSDRNHFGAVLTLVAPEGERVVFVVGARRSHTAQSLIVAIDQLARATEQGYPEALSLIASGYISPRSKEVLIERGISFVDTTGNIRLSASRPGLFIEANGSTKDPWPDDQPLRSLRGRGAGRATRALIDMRPPYGVRELASRAHLAPATLSRVIELLERDGSLTRGPNGGVTNLDWAGVIRRWVQDYGLRRSNSVSSFLDPRGLGATSESLRSATWRYAVTSSLAAQHFAPIAPPRTAVVYVDDALGAAIDLGLRPSDAGANVLLVEPFDPVVFERSQSSDGLVVVAPSQAVADLLTGPGTEPAEGQELIEWMTKHDDAWRS